MKNLHVLLVIIAVTIFIGYTVFDSVSIVRSNISKRMEAVDAALAGR